MKLYIVCLATPEQNGLAERRQRHFTELGLSMMFHSHLPLNLLVEAFAMASYISNLLPSSALENKKHLRCFSTRSQAIDL